MTRRSAATMFLGLCVAASMLTGAGVQPEAPPAEAKPAAAPLDRAMKLLDGTEKNLAEYKGRIVVIVNVASKCGFTSQYEGLEKLYKEKKDLGLVVLGFPANNFNGQEPGTSEEIAEFCTSKYGVTFPMFEKISVKGDDAHDLYKVLAASPEPFGGEPRWNFTKFVLDRDGNVVFRADADRKHVRTADLEPALLKKIDELLAAQGATPVAPPARAGD